MNLCMPMSFLTLSGEVFYFFSISTFAYFNFTHFPYFSTSAPWFAAGDRCLGPGSNGPVWPWSSRRPASVPSVPSAREKPIGAMSLGVSVMGDARWAWSSCVSVEQRNHELHGHDFSLRLQDVQVSSTIYIGNSCNSFRFDVYGFIHKELNDLLSRRR